MTRRNDFHMKQPCVHTTRLAMFLMFLDGNNTMSTTVQRKTYAVITTRDLEEGGFVGTCDELHAVSEGDTFGKIVENMKEAVELAAAERGSPIDFNMPIIEQ